MRCLLRRFITGNGARVKLDSRYIGDPVFAAGRMKNPPFRTKHSVRREPFTGIRTRARARGQSLEGNELGKLRAPTNQLRASASRHQ